MNLKSRLKKKRAVVNSDIRFETDAEPANDRQSLRHVTRLAEEMLDLQGELAKLEEEREKLNEEIAQIQLTQLPDLMLSLHLDSFTLSSGEVISIKPFLKASLPTETQIARERDPDKREDLKERLRRGLESLRKAGASSLIKTTLTAQLGKDSEPLARSALRALKDLGILARSERGVHPSTLSAWVKERLANGAPIDTITFSVFSGNKAEIQQPSSIPYKK